MSQLDRAKDKLQNLWQTWNWKNLLQRL